MTSQDIRSFVAANAASRPSFVRRHAKALAIGLSIGMLTASGIAFAAWTLSGSGNGYAKGGSPVSLTTLAITSAELTGDLAPGQTGSLTIRVHNSNGYGVKITSVSRDTANGITTTPPTCNSNNFTLTNQTGLSLGPVPANSDADIVVPNAVTMAAGAPVECEGALAQIPITLTAATA